MPRSDQSLFSNNRPIVRNSRRLRVLLSCYACEPNRGSEPGIGWELARALSEHHDIWVLTRANNASAIEKFGDVGPSLKFEFFDLPKWARWWKHRGRGVQAYYYLWQIGALGAARRLHSQVGFDLVHHVTFGRHWSPSFLAFLPVPFVLGPVGGADATPVGFRHDLGSRGRLYEFSREMAVKLGERDPFVRLTARRSRVALAATPATASRLRHLGAEDVQLESQIAATDDEISNLPERSAPSGRPPRFLSVGRLIHWKGFHLALRAFAEAAIPKSEYWIIGEGPERNRLGKLSRALGVDGQVRFLGALKRRDVLDTMYATDALLHPSLHESGGFVCLEAMAAGCPVVCLRLGGPAIHVAETCGFRISARDSRSAVAEMAAAMRRLTSDRALWMGMSRAAQARVAAEYRWTQRAKCLDDVYARALGNSWLPEEARRGPGSVRALAVDGPRGSSVR